MLLLLIIYNVSPENMSYIQIWVGFLIVSRNCKGIYILSEGYILPFCRRYLSFVNTWYLNPRIKVKRPWKIPPRPRSEFSFPRQTYFCSRNYYYLFYLQNYFGVVTDWNYILAECIILYILHQLTHSSLLLH